MTVRPGVVGVRPGNVPDGTGTEDSGHWGVVLALGVATVVLGIILSVWPEATLRVLAVLIAVQLLLTGLTSIVGAVLAREADSAVRVLVTVSGIIAILAGLVCLRAPQQTVMVLGLVLGIWWVFKGLTEMIRALGSPDAPAPRAVIFCIGLVTAAAGAYVVLNPHITFTILLVVAEVWLFGFGFLTIASALLMRSAERRALPR